MDIFSKITFIFAICLVNQFGIIKTNSSEKLRFCVVQHKSHVKYTTKICEKFASKDPVECIFKSDRLSCMKGLTDSSVDFAVFEPEDLVIYSGMYSNSHVLLTHELRLLHNEKTSFEMIALVSKDIINLSDLMGKKLCHPGYYSQSTEWTRVFANFFQSWIIPKKCEPNATLIENEFFSLSEYFYSACIPGPWVPDINEDKILKMKYPNLRALCGSPNDVGTTTDDMYFGRQGVIRCLVDEIGDVAWVRLADAQQYFKSIHMKNSSYNYICPDGIARPTDSGRPCIWISRPWPVIAAYKNNAVRVSKLIEESYSQSLPWHQYLIMILELYHTSPVELDTLKTPEDYLHQFNGFSSAYMRAKCSPPRDVKWCVASTIENKKCQWMRNVAMAYGIEPVIRCHEFHKRDDCIDAVADGQSEIFIVYPEEMAVAYEKNLTSLLQVMSKKIEDLNIFGILVKNDSNLRYLDDLRNTRICFPSYRGLEWNVFVNAMRTRIISKREMDPMWNCSDNKAMKHFFKEIITFNDLMKDNSKLGKSNLIESTYDCLISGRGDAAFVNLRYFNQTKKYVSQYKLRKICIDVSSDHTLEDECILVWAPLATVMVHANMTKLRRKEIQTMLNLLDESFGFKLRNENSSPFLIYGSFEHEDNVIFPMNTHYLQQDTTHMFGSAQNYVSILDQLRSPGNQSSICNIGNPHKTMKIGFVLIIVIILDTLF